MTPAQRFLVALPLVGVLGLLPRPALAAWPHDPNNGNVPVSVATNNQLYPTIVSDGAGGAIIAWEDIRGGVNYDIYVQRVDASGAPQWTANGLAICTASSDQQYPTIAADGSGGAIVAWYDNRSGNQDIYAQRVNAAGVPQWTANGVALCTAAGSQTVPVVVADGAGGAVFAWLDLRGGLSYDIYAQRVNAAGVPQWAANGVALCTAVDLQADLQIATDGAGGAIAVWDDFRNLANYDIYAQRVNASGVVQWAVNGITICNAASSQVYPSIASDDVGGAIMAWHDFRGGGADIYAQRVTSSGTSVWTPNGVGVCTNVSDQAYPSVAPDGAGGGIIAWEDFRGASWDIYAQRVAAGGAAQWTANGVQLCTAVSDQHGSKAISDGAGGAIVAWFDLRNSNYDVFAQRVNATGVTQWTFNGAAISTAALTQYNPTLAPDGSGGAILTWYDSRSGTYDIYAQRIEHFGVLGNPEPDIANVRDVLNDQGGRVKVTWYPSWLDGVSDPNLDAYDLYRSAPASLAQAAIEAGATRLAGFGERPPATGRAFVISPKGSQVYGWEYVGTVNPAHFLPSYGFIASTTGDSVGGSNPLSIFMVVARNYNGSMYWLSAPDSGYSVDNLPPSAPSPFAGAYFAGATHLHWGANSELDLAGYRLYRGSSPSFVPGPGNLVTAQPDTGYDDAGAAGSWYKLSAVDSHGNESLFAILGPGGTTDAPGPGAFTLAFARPAPDPAFGGEVTLRFTLPREGPATLVVMDTQGRLIRTLVAGTRPAGEQVIRWDLRNGAGETVPAGIYFLRLDAEGRTFTQRMVALR